MADALFGDGFGNPIGDVTIQRDLTLRIPEPDALLLLPTALPAAALAGRPSRPLRSAGCDRFAELA